MCLKEVVIVSGILFFAYWVMWIVTLSMLIRVTKNPKDIENYDLSYIYQVKDDWQTSPFVDVKMTTDSTCPLTHPELVLYELWPGATTFCDCIIH